MQVESVHHHQHHHQQWAVRSESKLSHSTATGLEARRSMI